jgi:shikimate dehydrogenase
MTDRIPLAGVIGASVAYSRSPHVHGYWLKKYGIAGHYVPMNVKSDDLEEVLRCLPKIGFRGVNVTIPHKERVLELARTVSDRAALIGAANTLTFKDEAIHADNTDGYGFIANLRAGVPDWDPSAGPAAVLGAGGAARAVVASLLDAGVPEIHIANRTRTRAEGLREAFGGRVIVRDWVQAGNMIEGAATVVNTSSLGMTGHPEMRVPLDGLSRNAVVTDLVYAPLETRLLKEARKAGCRTVDGLGMLLHQAVPGFERWFGVKPEVDEALRQAVLA